MNFGSNGISGNELLYLTLQNNSGRRSIGFFVAVVVVVVVNDDLSDVVCDAVLLPFVAGICTTGAIFLSS